MKKNNGKKLNKSKIIKLIVLVIVVIMLITAGVLYSKNDTFRKVLDRYIFRKNTYENNLPYIEIDSSKTTGMCAYSKYIAIMQGNKLDLYNKYGKKETTIEIEVSTPIFVSNKNYLAVAEKNGNKLYIINGKNIVWQKDMEGKVTDISINSNGYVAVSIAGTSYKTVIKTFDNKGNELFTNYLAKTNVVDMEISNDNKYLALAEANFSGIVVQSTIKIISIEDAKNNTGDSIKYTHIANGGDLIINMKYQKNNLVCMYDEHIDVINNNENSELVNFKNEDVLFADINFPSKVTKIIKNSKGLFNSEAEMQIIDSNSKAVTTYSIESLPKSIFVRDNIIVVNLGTSALFIKDNGWLEKEYESTHEIQSIIASGEIAGIVSKNRIEIISL